MKLDPSMQKELEEEMDRLSKVDQYVHNSRAQGEATASTTLTLAKRTLRLQLRPLHGCQPHRAPNPRSTLTLASILITYSNPYPNP